MGDDRPSEQRGDRHGADTSTDQEHDPASADATTTARGELPLASHQPIDRYRSSGWPRQVDADPACRRQGQSLASVPHLVADAWHRIPAAQPATRVRILIAPDRVVAD